MFKTETLTCWKHCVKKQWKEAVSSAVLEWQRRMEMALEINSMCWALKYDKLIKMRTQLNPKEPTGCLSPVLSASLWQGQKSTERMRQPESVQSCKQTHSGISILHARYVGRFLIKIRALFKIMAVFLHSFSAQPAVQFTGSERGPSKWTRDQMHKENEASHLCFQDDQIMPGGALCASLLCSCVKHIFTAQRDTAETFC